MTPSSADVPTEVPTEVPTDTFTDSPTESPTFSTSPLNTISKQTVLPSSNSGNASQTSSSSQPSDTNLPDSGTTGNVSSSFTLTTSLFHVCLSLGLSTLGLGVLCW